MAETLSVKPRDEVFSISQTEPDVNRPIFFDRETAPEVKFPKPAEAADAPPGMVSVDELPLDQQTEFYAQVQATPTQPGNEPPAGMQDAVEAYKGNPAALFDLSVATKGKFDLEQWALENPERVKDPEIATTIADAMAMEKERGFKLRDVDWGAAATALIHLPLDITKWGSRAADLITAEVGQTFVKPLTPAAQREFDKDQAKQAAELVTGTDVGLENLAGLVHKGVDKSARKVAEWTGIRAKPTERTPEEKLADMHARIAAAKRRELTARGNGILTQTFLGGVMEDLKRDGVELDPEAVRTFAAGDPVTFAAFGEGFKIIGKSGKAIGSVSTRGQAIRTMQKLQAAQQVAARAGADHAAALEAAGKAMDAEQSIARAAAGTKSAPIPGELPLTDSARTMTAGSTAQSAVKTAETAGKTAAQAEADFARAAELAGQPLKGTVGHVARVADAAANVADWSRKAAATAAERGTDFVLGTAAGVAGAAAKAAQFGTWAFRGVTPELVQMPVLKAAPKVLGAIGDKALSSSAALLKNAPERLGPSIRMASDAAKAATVDIPSGMVDGTLMDLTLAAITSETPTENANAGFMMSAIGGLQGVRFGASRLVKGQMAALKNYGSDWPVRDLGNFADLDAATELSLRTSDKAPGVTRRLAAMREFFGPANTEMHFVSDPKQFEDVLRKYYPGMTEENIAKARNAGGVNIPNVAIPGTNRTRNLSIFNELSAAEHEGIHGWQNVFSTAGRQKLNELARTEYAQEWEQIGDGYVNRFLTPEQRANYARNGESWREALIDFTQGDAAWRDDGWTPDQIRDTADNYIASEIVADVGASILQSNRGSLEKSPGFPGKLARVIGKTMDGMGVEPFAGASTPQIGIPLKFGAREGIRLGLRDAIAGAGDEAIRAKFEVAKAGKPVSEKPVVSPAGESASDAEIAASAPDTANVRGGRTQREIAADLISARNAGAGVVIDYMQVRGTPGGDVVSSRVARRAEIEAARQAVPADVRALWEKTFFPEKLSRTQSGAIQVQGWSPEVFAANAHKLAAELHRAKAGDLTPYPIDPKTGTFTADGWRLLFDDTVQFSKNQMAGLTGAGEPLVVPKSVTDRGFTAPTELGEPGRKLNQDRADVISMLMGIPLPKSGRVGTVFPRNLAGQAVSAATKPGRVSPLVEPRTFTGKNAEKFGVEGEQVREVNPLRAELELRGIKPDMIEAIQRLNLENIADVTPDANIPVVRGREFTVQAGFAPKANEKLLDTRDAKRWLTDLKASYRPNVGMTELAWEAGRSGATAEGLKQLQDAQFAARENFDAAKSVKDFDSQMAAAFQKQFFDEAVRASEALAEVKETGASTREQFAAIELKHGIGGVDKGAWLEAQVSGESPAPAKFSPKTDAGKELEKRGFSLEHSGYPGFRSISVSKDGKVVGEILSATQGDPEQVHVAGVSVNKDFQKQGISETLYRELFTDLQADGVTLIDGYVVHPAPIKTREKLLGEGMTNYYSQGKPISIEQALADVSGDKVSGPRAVSALAPDIKFSPKTPDKTVNEVADEYAKARGLTYKDVSAYTQLDTDLTRRIGQAYEDAKHAPDDPEVRASYEALIEETMAQYEALKKAGYEIEVVSHDPYGANIDDMLRDIRENKHVAILSTKQSFTEPSDYPMLRPVPGTDMVVNDIFRAVHDINGHARLGTNFTDEGEFNAWKSHQQMYSDEAQGALATETLGQNAWNTNGPHYYKDGKLMQPGDEGYVPPADQPFASQKATVIPKELIDEARASFAPKTKKGDDKTVAVIHKSSQPGLKSVDPKYFGKGNATPGDLRGGNKSYFFVKGSKLGQDENIFGDQAKLNTYEGEIPMAGLYDLRKGKDDPLGWRRTVNREEADDLVQASGYAGLLLDTADGRQVVAMFKPVKVKPSFAPKTKGETEGLPGLDVPREYVTPAERASMTRQEVRERFPEAVVPRANGETIPSGIVKSPLYKQAKSEAEAVKLFADRLVKFADEYKDNPEYELGSRWYSEFTPMLKKEFGKDSGLMAELLAATSPQTGVETNFGYAFDALQSLRAGRFDKIIPKFNEGLEKMEDGSWEPWLKRNKSAGPATPANFMAHWIETHNLKPTQSNGKLFGQHSTSVLKVFARRWMDSNAGPKTRNFVGNLLGKSDEATIDLWADRTMRWAGYEGLQDRWRVLPENFHSVADADYAFAEKVFRAAAEQLGVKPSALQGALWFAEKKRWSDNGWGRLDLGNFQNEMEKLPLLRAGFEQRLVTKKAKSKTKPAEQLGFDISERFK